MKKAYIETYGCQMNISDSELMAGILAEQGFVSTDTPDDADVILVNTCAIRDHAEQRVIGRVGQLQQFRRGGAVVGVTGCMAQRMGESLLGRAGGVDLVMGPDAYRQLPQKLADVSARRTPPPALPLAHGTHAPQQPRGLTVLGFDPHENYEGVAAKRVSAVSAWVPIQRGCNYRCTYCIVPYVRGDEKNRDPRAILAEVRQLAADGVPEVTLLGQTVNSWEHGDWSFPRLLREVARVDGIRRVRFTSPHPNGFTRELVEVMAAEPAVCRQLHLPVQAGHDRTLKRMLRRYTVAEYLEKIEWVRAAMPGIALSTDVIVAFPGETEEEYEATLELMRHVRYDDAFLYRYSEREGTPATRLPRDQFVPEDIGQARLERLIETHRQIQSEIYHAEVGRVEEVLVEKEGRRGGVQGRTAGNKVVTFDGPASLIGTFAEVRLTGTSGSTFSGELVESAELAEMAA
ncbi:tRNA (N6-isopentenyl adenosine(37)-C2)-methylthiotransferase MiaB [Longimicrobium sp.]|uniref:tRNA (N6-isopentenyl adenosine(37)-C2)-methylthiotransferase MiaB n=1 Tax=Longimicrobium sp. TaxID=2029185 RepID=UPI002C95924B|nr:tRNA (N6-isopentenyl adenosine(37)-C2)-methylthiotransferase MiaB [Longimicrobium sp.]HSU12840.1 tRNA (N6-isopentenyl adenosine(37)-C2)-methylthiotransferase MiaB [Longimicrobium sp.]